MKYITYLFLLIMLSGCYSKFSSKINKNHNFNIDNVTFSKIDKDGDGLISELEFDEAKSYNSIDAVTPMLWFLGIMAITSVLLFFSSPKKCKNTKCLK